MAVKIDGFVFDLDGTVYLGNAALPGSVEQYAELHRHSKRVLFVSNKPLETAGVMPPTRHAWASRPTPHGDRSGLRAGALPGAARAAPALLRGG